MKAILTLVLISLGVVASATGLFGKARASDAIIDGRILPRSVVDVKSGVHGVVEEVFVKPGIQVKQGDPVARIKLIIDYLALHDAKTELEIARLELAHAQVEFDRSKQMIKAAHISRSELENQSLVLEIKTAKVANAIKKVGLITSGLDGDSGQYNIVYARHSGTVLSVEVQAGDYITAASDFNSGTTLAKIADMDELIFTGHIKERDIERFQIGRTLSVKLNAMPSIMVSAEIENVSFLGEYVNSDILFEFSASIDGKHYLTSHVGLTGTATLEDVNAGSLLAKK